MEIANTSGSRSLRAPLVLVGALALIVTGCAADPSGGTASGGSGGSGGGKSGGKGSGIFGAILIAAAVGFGVIIWPGQSVYQVQPSEVGVVMRFGEYVRTAPPGLNLKMPWPIESVEMPNVTETRTIAISIYDRVQAFDTAGAGIMSAFLLLSAFLAIAVVYGVGARAVRLRG